MLGIDGMTMLRTRDLEESVVLGAVIRRARELREEMMEKQAELITNKIADAWNRGQK